MDGSVPQNCFSSTSDLVVSPTNKHWCSAMVVESLLDMHNFIHSIEFFVAQNMKGIGLGQQTHHIPGTTEL